jgi:hypothetical protein
MRKTLFLVVIVTLAMLAISPVFAKDRSNIHIGVEFGNPTLVAIFRLNILDLRLGYDFTGIATDNGGNFIYLAADLRIVDSYPISGPLHFFLCAGIFTELVMSDGGGENVFGIRIPVGLSLLLFNDKVELFAEIAPTFGLIPRLEFRNGDFQGWIGFTFALPV